MEGALGFWLMTVLPQNTLMQELENSQRQIEEQHHHKVPAARQPPSQGGRGLCWVQLLWCPAQSEPIGWTVQVASLIFT